ncbi:MAG: hypothetical protein FIB07_04855 [Candidatus Methanoperedens sp.]|nr:hypothetical protein [Candidatus Methanoperedens sp.]
MIDYYPVPGFGILKSEILDMGLCSGCSIVCPRAGVISQKLQKDWEILDRHAIICSARSTDDGILKVCQDRRL